jgi:hypothetical protein
MDGGSEAEDFPRPMCAPGPAQLLRFRRCEESDGLACIDVVRAIHGGSMVLDFVPVGFRALAVEVLHSRMITMDGHNMLRTKYTRRRTQCCTNLHVSLHSVRVPPNSVVNATTRDSNAWDSTRRKRPVRTVTSVCDIPCGRVRQRSPRLL